MRKLISMTLLAATMATSSFAGASGTWKTGEFSGVTGGGASGEYLYVEIVENGDFVEGTITQEFNSDGTIKDGSKLVGEKMLIGVAADGSKKGKMWHPYMDKKFKAKGFELSDENTINLKGCVGFICMGQTWTRVN